MATLNAVTSSNGHGSNNVPSFCSSIGAVNIEILTSFDTGLVNTNLMGPTSQFVTSAGAPYYVYPPGKGPKLIPGTYTLSAMAMTGMSLNMKQATFVVDNC